MSPGKHACPICGKSARHDESWFPFCCARCRTLDLANWATGEYSIPVPRSEADEYLEAASRPEERDADD